MAYLVILNDHRKLYVQYKFCWI